MNLVFGKSNNDNYDFLISKGFRNISFGAINDAYKCFDDAKKLLLDPVEAYIGIAFIDVIEDNYSKDYLGEKGLDVDEFLMQHVEELIKNPNFEIAKRMSTSSSSETSATIENIETIAKNKIISLKLKKAKSILTYNDVYFHFGDFKSGDELLDYFETSINENEEVREILLKLTNKYAQDALVDGHQTMVLSAIKHIKTNSFDDDLKDVLIQLEKKKESNKIHNLFTRGLLASEEEISVTAFEKHQVNFVNTIRMYYFAISNFKDVPYFNSQFSKYTIERINSSVYRAILDYLPTFLDQSKGEERATVLETLDKLLELEPDLSHDFDTCKSRLKKTTSNKQLNCIENSPTGNAIKKEKKSIKNWFKSFFR